MDIYSFGVVILYFYFNKEHNFERTDESNEMNFSFDQMQDFL